MKKTKEKFKQIEDWIAENGLRTSEYARIKKGMSIEDLSKGVGIGSSRFHEWKKTGELKEYIKRGVLRYEKKLERETINNLFLKTEKHTKKKKKYALINGKPSLVEVIEEDVEPDLGSIIFVLTNISEFWKNKQNVNGDIKVQRPIIQVSSEEEKKMVEEIINGDF